MGNSVTKRINQSWHHTWCVVQDKEEHIITLRNNYDPTKLDAIQVNFEIIPFLFESFDLCYRPDDFIVTLNDVVATCHHATLPDSAVYWQSFLPIAGSGDPFEVIKLSCHYPNRSTNPLPWTDVYPTARPVLRMSKTVTAFPPYTPPALPDNQIRVTVQDTTKGNGEVLKFTIDINATFDKVSVSHQKWSEILQKTLAGTYFAVSEVDAL